MDNLWAGGRINTKDDPKPFPKDGCSLKYIQRKVFSPECGKFVVIISLEACKHESIPFTKINAIGIRLLVFFR